MVLSDQDPQSDGTRNTQGQNHSDIVKPRRRLNWTGDESITDMAQGKVHGVDELDGQDVPGGVIDKKHATESQDEIRPINEKKTTKTLQADVTT